MDRQCINCNSEEGRIIRIVDHNGHVLHHVHLHEIDCVPFLVDRVSNMEDAVILGWKHGYISTGAAASMMGMDIATFEFTHGKKC